MSRPPKKAVEQIVSYCKKRSYCADCFFGIPDGMDRNFLITRYRCFFGDRHEPIKWGNVEKIEQERKDIYEGFLKYNESMNTRRKKNAERDNGKRAAENGKVRHLDRTTWEYRKN